VLGEYIAAIHAQVRRRPLVIERERVNFDDEDAAAGSLPAIYRPQSTGRIGIGSQPAPSEGG
jgi:hypothetical protein